MYSRTAARVTKASSVTEKLSRGPAARPAKVFLLILLGMTGIFASSCSPGRADMPGVYYGIVKADDESFQERILQLYSNGTFEYKVSGSNSISFWQSGNWDFTSSILTLKTEGEKDQRLQFSGDFLIPISDDPLINKLPWDVRALRKMGR